MKSLINVVVFSSKGIRPDYNKMASGDLDGDIYFVVYNHTIIQHAKNIRDPSIKLKNIGKN